MQKVSILLSLLVINILLVSFNFPNKAKVHWLSIADMQLAYKKEPKPILVDVYTSWCGWCKVMDKQTYGKEKVANYINEHYYAVRLDAESKDEIEWNGKKYGFNTMYKSNQLAIDLLYAQMSFPTTVLLPSLDGSPAPFAGYLTAKEIEAPLRFFAENFYKSTMFPKYLNKFKGSW